MGKKNIDPYATTIIRSSLSAIMNDEDEALLLQDACQEGDNPPDFNHHSDRSFLLEQFKQLFIYWRDQFEELLGDERWNYQSSFLLLGPIKPTYLGLIPIDSFYKEEEKRVLDAQSQYDSLLKLGSVINFRLPLLNEFMKVDSDGSFLKTSPDLVEDEFRIRMELFNLLSLIEKYIDRLNHHSEHVLDEARPMLLLEFRKLSKWIRKIRQIIGGYYAFCSKQYDPISEQSEEPINFNQPFQMQPYYEDQSDDSEDSHEEEIIQPVSPYVSPIEWSMFKQSRKAYERDFTAGDSSDLLPRAKAIFQNYVDGTKGFNRLFHFKRHHAADVARILANSEINSCEKLIEEMKTIQYKSDGSLARRIAFVEEKLYSMQNCPAVHILKS